MWQVDTSPSGDGLTLKFRSNPSGPWEEYIVQVVSGPKQDLIENNPQAALQSRLNETFIQHNKTIDTGDTSATFKTNDTAQQAVQKLRVEKEELALQLETTSIELQKQMTSYVELLEERADSLSKNNNKMNNELIDEANQATQRMSELRELHKSSSDEDDSDSGNDGNDGNDDNDDQNDTESTAVVVVPGDEIDTSRVADSDAIGRLSPVVNQSSSDDDDDDMFEGGKLYEEKKKRGKTFFYFFRSLSPKML